MRMDDVTNSALSNYDRDLLTYAHCPTQIQLGSTSFSNQSRSVTENNGDVAHQRTTRPSKYRLKSHSGASGVGRPSCGLQEDKDVSKIYDSTKGKSLRTSDGITLLPDDVTYAKSYLVDPFRTSIEITEKFDQELTQLQQNRNNRDDLGDGSSHSRISCATVSSADDQNPEDPRDFSAADEEAYSEDEEVGRENHGASEPNLANPYCKLPMMSASTPRLPITHADSSSYLDHAGDHIIRTKKGKYYNVSQVKGELDVDRLRLNKNGVPLRQASNSLAADMRPYSCGPFYPETESQSTVHLSNSDGMNQPRPDQTRGQQPLPTTSASSIIRSDSTVSEKSSKSLTSRISASFSKQKSKEPTKLKTPKKSFMGFNKSSKKSKHSSDHNWVTVHPAVVNRDKGTEGVATTSSGLFHRKVSNVHAGAPAAIPCCSKCNKHVDISNPSPLLRCTNCGVTVHADESCKESLDVDGCSKAPVITKKSKKMSISTALSGGGPGSNSSSSKRKLSARNSVTGASGASTTTGSYNSIPGAISGSYGALPRVNSNLSLDGHGCSAASSQQQLGSPATPTSEFNQIAGPIQEEGDEKDSGIVSEIASNASGHNANTSHPKFASAHVRSSSVMTHNHPSAIYASTQGANSPISNRHSTLCNVPPDLDYVGGQPRRDSSPSNLSMIHKTKSTPDLFASTAEKLGHQMSTEFTGIDEADARQQSRFRLDLQRSSTSHISLEEWELWGWTSSESRWDQQVPPHVLSTLQKYTVQEQSAIQELIVTEVNFITNLDIVEDIYVYNIVNSIDWDQWNVTKSFGSGRNDRVAEILFGPPEVRINLRRQAKKLLTALCELRKICRADESYVMDASSVLQNHFCDLENMEIYVNAFHYLTAGQNNAKRFYDEAMEAVPVFAKFMRECSNTPLLKRRNLLDTRTAITQRPHKYTALFASLVRSADKELDHVRTGMTSQLDNMTSSKANDVKGVTSQIRLRKMEMRVMDKKARLENCDKCIGQILDQLNLKLKEYDLKEKFENFMNRTDNKIVQLNFPKGDGKDREQKRETVEKYDKNMLMQDKELQLMADFSVKLTSDDKNKQKCVQFLVMNKCVILLEVKDASASNAQYTLLSVPKQRPVIRAENLKISSSETLSEEQAHLIDTDQPLLNIITCKSRSEKIELVKVCDSIKPVKETPLNAISNDVTANFDQQPKNHNHFLQMVDSTHSLTTHETESGFKKSHSSVAASSADHHRLAVNSNHRSHSQPKSQAYHMNAIMDRNHHGNSAISSNSNKFSSATAPTNSHVGVSKNNRLSNISTGTGSSWDSNERLDDNVSPYISSNLDPSQFADPSSSPHLQTVNSQSRLSARAELCWQQLACLLDEMSFYSMNEEGQQILENNISSLMRDLSVLRNSVPVGTFSGDLQQHHVVSRTQSCKVPLESGAHKGVRSVGAGGHDVSSANGRLTSTGGATRRHATFTTTQANRGHFDPDVSSASSEGPRNKIEVNCTCGSGANKQIAKLESELDCVRQELFRSKSEILQIQLDFFVKECKLKQYVDSMQRLKQPSDIGDVPMNSAENLVLEDLGEEPSHEVYDNNNYYHPSELFTRGRTDPVAVYGGHTQQSLSSSTTRGLGGKETRGGIPRFLTSDITSSTPDAKTNESSFTYQQKKRNQSMNDVIATGFNGPSSFPGVESALDKSFHLRNGPAAAINNPGAYPPPMSPPYNNNNNSLDSSLILDSNDHFVLRPNEMHHSHVPTPKASITNSALISAPQSSSQLRRTTYVTSNKPKQMELKQQLPTKLAMASSLSSSQDGKRSSKTSVSTAGGPSKIPTDRSKGMSESYTSIQSRRKGGNSPSLTLQYESSGSYTPQASSHVHSSSADWEGSNDLRGSLSGTSSRTNSNDVLQMNKNHYSPVPGVESSPNYGAYHNFSSEERDIVSGKEDGIVSPYGGTYEDNVDIQATAAKTEKNSVPEETTASKQKTASSKKVKSSNSTVFAL